MHVTAANLHVTAANMHVTAANVYVTAANRMSLQQICRSDMYMSLRQIACHCSKYVCHWFNIIVARTSNASFKDKVQRAIPYNKNLDLLVSIKHNYHIHHSLSQQPHIHILIFTVHVASHVACFSRLLNTTSLTHHSVVCVTAML